MVKRLLAGTMCSENGDKCRVRLDQFVRERRDEIRRSVQRAEELGREFRRRPAGFVLCHGDVHIANVLIDAVGRLLIVDWDQPVLAPRERDLMFVMGTALRVLSPIPRRRRRSSPDTGRPIRIRSRLPITDTTGRCRTSAISPRKSWRRPT
jgi:hypothetical protein